MINCNNIINDKNLNLRKKSDDVSLPLSDEDKNTIYQMHEYLVNGYDEKLCEELNIKPGVGLAAPQINILNMMNFMNMELLIQKF